tara:strand:+ start:5626 stop:6030 length:405 start_codon:yes stop_codon:yes gene_type:complete
MSNNKITAAKANMMQMAKNGGLAGFKNGGGAYDGLMKAQDGNALDGPMIGAAERAQSIVAGAPGVTPEGPTTYVQNKTRRDGTNKNKEISAKKFNRVSNRYANQKGSNTLGTSTSRGQQVISGRNSGNSVSRRS